MKNKARLKEVKGGSVHRLRPKRRPKVAYWKIALLALFILFAVWSIYPLREQWEKRRELAGLEQELKKLEEENRTLRAEIARLQTDEYIEQMARERLGLVKPGEELYFVLPDKDGANSESLEEEGQSDAGDQTKALTLWERFIGFFRKVSRGSD